MDAMLSVIADSDGYANSTIAIDVDTGKIVWHYQHVPNDSWDFDSIGENIPFDYKKDGKVTKAVGMFHKDGFFYVKAVRWRRATWASRRAAACGRSSYPSRRLTLDVVTLPLLFRTA